MIAALKVRPSMALSSPLVLFEIDPAAIIAAHLETV